MNKIGKINSETKIKRIRITYYCNLYKRRRISGRQTKENTSQTSM